MGTYESGTSGDQYLHITEGSKLGGKREECKEEIPAGFTLPRDRRGLTPSAVGSTLPRDRRGITPSAVGSTLRRDRRGITPSAVGSTLPRGITPSAVGSTLPRDRARPYPELGRVTRSGVTGAALPRAR